jgi:hypothetical protein
VIENKILRYVIPALFVLSLMVHMSAVLCYAVLFGIILLYRISVEEDSKKKKSYLTVFIISMVFTASLAVYFLAFKKEMPIDVDEFNSLLEGRGGKYFVYYDYTFYDHNYYEHTLLYPAELYDIENPVVRAVRLAFARLYFLHTEYKRVYMPNYFDRILRIAVSLVLLAAPMTFFYKKMIKFFRSVGENKLKKFCVFLMMIQFPFTLVLGCLFSLDIIRWFAHAFIISFSILLYVMTREDELKNDVLSSVEKIRSQPAVWIWALAYFFVSFSAYT